MTKPKITGAGSPYLSRQNLTQRQHSGGWLEYLTAQNYSAVSVRTTANGCYRS